LEKDRGEPMKFKKLHLTQSRKAAMEMHFILKVKIEVIVFFCFTHVLWAGGAGSQAAPWILIPDGSRQAAMAGSAGALLDNAEALGVNPAGLADLSVDEVAFTQAFWAQGLSMERLAYGHSFGNLGLAVGGDYLNFGSVDFYNLNASGLPVANGTFTPSGMEIQAGLGFKNGNTLALGFEIKGLNQSLTPNDQSWAFATNLGLLIEDKKSNLRMGLALENLGTDLDSAGLPTVVDLAGAWGKTLGPDHHLSLSADGSLNFQSSDNSTAGVGVEYSYKEVVTLRMGYRADLYGNLSGLTGFSAGVGVLAAPLELGYAMTALGDLGTAQEISLRFSL
jgi:hypothetical protein